MSRIMLEFSAGEVIKNMRSEHPILAKATSLFVSQVLVKDPDWPEDYNKWDCEGQDWGWLSSGKVSGVSAKMEGVLKKYDFKRSETPWGGIKFRKNPRDSSVPKDLDSITLAEAFDCIVCMETLPEGETVTILPCKHIFHGSCILVWLFLNGRCAICRQDPVEIVDNLNKLKDQGNKAARSGQFQQAVDRYQESLVSLNKFTDIPALRFAIYSNLALMYLRLKTWKDGESYARLAMDVSGLTAEQIGKATYRQGLANIELDNWDSAQDNLETAMRYVPGDVAIQRALVDLEARRGSG